MLEQKNSVEVMFKNEQQKAAQYQEANKEIFKRRLPIIARLIQVNVTI